MTINTFADAFRKNFLGKSPDWYKNTVIGFLILNPVLFAINPFLAGWVLVLEFIFTLAMALKCYPLQPGGLLAVEAIAIGMATPQMVFHEAEVNFPVILLLIFMVAGIYFLREMLLFTFTKLLVGIRSKVLLSLMFSFTAAFLSAFLDALTVTAVVITVAAGFYGVYHRVASGKQFDHSHDAASDEEARRIAAARGLTHVVLPMKGDMPRLFHRVRSGAAEDAPFSNLGSRMMKGEGLPAWLARESALDGLESCWFGGYQLVYPIAVWRIALPSEVVPTPIEP